MLPALPPTELYSCALLHFQRNHFNILLLVALVQAKAIDIILGECGALKLLPSLKRETSGLRRLHGTRRGDGPSTKLACAKAWYSFPQAKRSNFQVHETQVVWTQGGPCVARRSLTLIPVSYLSSACGDAAQRQRVGGDQCRLQCFGCVLGRFPEIVYPVNLKHWVRLRAAAEAAPPPAAKEEAAEAAEAEEERRRQRLAAEEAGRRERQRRREEAAS
eukprot:1987123-Prymnesium_polylepis.3